MRRIRVRIAGIYCRDDKILLVRHSKYNHEYYLLPGGGQEPGESAIDALKREWKEELNLRIKPGRFLFWGESVPPKNLKNKSQVIQMVFKVEDIKGSIHVKKDGALVGHDWINITDLPHTAFFPACVEQIQAYLDSKTGSDIERYRRYRWLK